MELTVAYRDKKSFEAICRGHQWKMDTPEKYGGEDQAPTPTEVFISSLGACIGMYIVGYCKNTDMDISDLTIKLDWKIGDSSKRVEKMDIEINLPKVDITGKKKTILKVAKKCLIHNTLLNPPEINIDFAK